jgi:hypothetical protein
MLAALMAFGTAACGDDDGGGDGGSTGDTTGDTETSTSTSVTTGTTSATSSSTTSASTTSDPTTSSTTSEPTSTTDDATGSTESSTSGDTTGGSSTGEEVTCTPNAAIDCTDDELTVCNDDGDAQLTSACAMGCHDSEIRCNDLDPSNGLATLLDAAAGAQPLDLGTDATIDTQSGAVTVDENPVVLASVLVPGTPDIRVFAVASLTAQDVTVVRGANRPALAFVSDGDVQINGTFSLSALNSSPGAGVVNSGGCQGGDQVVSGNDGNTAASGAGGGGFGTIGARGGNAVAQTASATGGDPGSTVGTATLVPLRGGCDSGVVGASLRGTGGGAIQISSRTQITIGGILAANGSSDAGGGSGGGILLEAPIVSVSGNVVANGGGGGGGGFAPIDGEDGQLDASPAEGGPGNGENLGEGGNGAAGNTGATQGQNINYLSGLGTDINFAGHGGGGVGRIRVNTYGAGFTNNGVFSPNASTGDVAVR